MKPAVRTALLVLFLVAMGARVYLARKEKEDRERMMASLMAHSAEFNRQQAEVQSKALDDQLRAEREADLRKLEEARAKVELSRPTFTKPAFATADAGAAPAEPPAPAKPTLAWNDSPPAMFVTWADLAASSVEGAWGASIADGAKKKALGKRLRGIHDRLKAALGSAERFADPKVVRAELDEAKACDALIDAALSAKGPHRAMAHENLATFVTGLESVPTGP